MLYFIVGLSSILFFGGGLVYTYLNKHEDLDKNYILMSLAFTILGIFMMFQSDVLVGDTVEIFKDEKVFTNKETIIAGDFEYTITNKGSTDTLKDFGTETQALGEYLIIEVEIKNNSNYPFKMDTLMSTPFYIINEGSFYEVNKDLSRSLSNEELSNHNFWDRTGSTNPGNSVPGYIVFDIPKEVIEAEATQLLVQTDDSAQNDIYLNINKSNSHNINSESHVEESNTIEQDIKEEKKQDIEKEKKMEDVEIELLEIKNLDGNYQMRVSGHNGPLTVEVSIHNNNISEVKVIEHEETEGLTDSAIEEIPKRIVASNSTSVHVISGATITSEAIIEAVNLVLKNQIESKDAKNNYVESPQEPSLDVMRNLAQQYVNDWNGYDNLLLEEDWNDDGIWRYYIFQDGPTQHLIGVIVHSKTGEVRGDYGGID